MREAEIFWRIKITKNNKFVIVDWTMVMACHDQKQITVVNTKSRRLSGKLHCLNFVFPAENEILYPVYLGHEASSSSVSLSILRSLKSEKKFNTKN